MYKRQLIGLGKEVINQYLKKLEYLTKKYEITMHDISQQIDESEKALSEMLSNLTGNAYDIKGILEFKKLLRGEAVSYTHLDVYKRQSLHILHKILKQSQITLYLLIMEKLYYL